MKAKKNAIKAQLNHAMNNGPSPSRMSKRLQARQLKKLVDEERKLEEKEAAEKAARLAKGEKRLKSLMTHVKTEAEELAEFWKEAKKEGKKIAKEEKAARKTAARLRKELPAMGVSTRVPTNANFNSLARRMEGIHIEGPTSARKTGNKSGNAEMDGGGRRPRQKEEEEEENGDEDNA